LNIDLAVAFRDMSWQLPDCSLDDLTSKGGFVMTSVKKMLAVATAFAMVSSPVVASAATAASKLSVVQTTKARAGTKTTKANELGGSIALALLAAAAVIAGIVVAADGGNKAKTP
jgi:hypothetical protein